MELAVFLDTDKGLRVRDFFSSFPLISLLNSPIIHSLSLHYSITVNHIQTYYSLSFLCIFDTFLSVNDKYMDATAPVCMDREI